MPIIKSPKPNAKTTDTGEELPTGEAIGWVETKRGWVVVRFNFQGDGSVFFDPEGGNARVLVSGLEVVTGPDPRHLAAEYMKRALVTRILPPKN